MRAMGFPTVSDVLAGSPRLGRERLRRRHARCLSAFLLARPGGSGSLSSRRLGGGELLQDRKAVSASSRMWPWMSPTPTTARTRRTAIPF
jgi:hypothetical protein